MSFSSSKIYVLPWLTTLMTIVTPQLILAQNGDGHTVVIGEMTGRTDYRELQVPTRYGEFKIYDGGRPFRVDTSNPNLVIIHYIKQTGFSEQNPDRLIYKFYESGDYQCCK